MTSYTVNSSDYWAVEAEGLVKTFGDKRAVDGFDLRIRPGKVCGLLGPNGAGKTTVVRILTTLMRADGGTARVAGYDVATEAQNVRASIGLSGQSPAVDEILSGRQNLVMFGRLNGFNRRTATERAAELLASFDLEEAADRPIKKYSGGMRRRIDLAVTLILAPTVLFLDEPTTGLDPRNRNEVWAAIRALVAQGTTVMLTTQYLEEADQLADEIVVMDQGRVVSAGTPAALKSQIGSDRIVVTFADVESMERARALLDSSMGGSVAASLEQRQLSVAVSDRVDGLQLLLSSLSNNGIRPTNINVHEPSLDDVFLTLTGKTTTQGTTDHYEESA